jgi:hypothetical protein
VAVTGFRLLFRLGARSVRHDPDFFAVHRNGDQVVCDVKPSARMTREVRDQFDEAARVCRAIGEGRAMINRRSPALAMPHIKHLIWHRQLVADLTQRLDFDTVATTTTQDRPCAYPPSAPSMRRMTHERKTSSAVRSRGVGAARAAPRFG